MISKRGDLTSREIALIIVAVLSFIVVLGFLALWDWKGYSEEETCHLSVLARATGSQLTEAAKSYMPLKCKTKKICITSGSGKCEDSFAVEKPEIVQLPKDENEAVRLIEKTTTEELFSCWKMMGEGKLDLFGSYAQSRAMDIAKPTCVICSRLALDKSVSKNIIDKINIREYMRTTKIPGSDLTYLEKMTDKGVRSYPKVDSAIYEVDKAKAEGINLDIQDEKQVSVVFSQIKTIGFGEAISNLGSDAFLVAGTAFITPGIGNLAKRLVLTATGIKIVAVAAATGVGMAAYNNWQSQEIAAGYCGSLETSLIGKDESKGCSLVQVVPYSYTNIKRLCTYLEGSP
ncbi:MAG: hypothetical protein N3D20_01435 [Candidatus Pacearchaeota archaeon]|nr:hypothetical protein [Candidatus Pacearchaeota archaeon]